MTYLRRPRGYPAPWWLDSSGVMELYQNRRVMGSIPFKRYGLHITTTMRFLSIYFILRFKCDYNISINYTLSSCELSNRSKTMKTSPKCIHNSMVNDEALTNP